MKKAIATAALFAFPLLVSAQQVNNLTNAISLAGDLLNRLIPVLIAGALVIFFWGLIKYIRNGKEGRDTIIAGLLGLFIMVSVWGIIRIAQNTLGVSNQGTDIRGNIPQVPQR